MSTLDENQEMTDGFSPAADWDVQTSNRVLYELFYCAERITKIAVTISPMEDHDARRA